MDPGANMKKIVAIVGPTGVGKSRVALETASDVGADIVNADSRQIYRYMDIGTAKPSISDREKVKHHLIDIIYPDEPFSLAEYLTLAQQCVNRVYDLGHLPLLTGGSGQYVRALLEGWQVPRIQPDPELRLALEEKARILGADQLYQELLKIDPAAAGRIDARNTRRVIRALEIASGNSGKPPVAKQPIYHSLAIGLTARREILYDMIDTRVDAMIQQGLIEEVANLLEKGYGPDLPAMSSIGYRQICSYLAGNLTLDGAIEQIKFESHRLVRKQYNWFRLKDPHIKWFDIMQKDYYKHAIAQIEEFVKN